MKILLQGWTFMRFLRLGIGLYAIVQAISSNEWILGVAGAWILLMAVLNIGCCGVGGCAVNASARSAKGINQIEYEEMDSK